MKEINAVAGPVLNRLSDNAITVLNRRYFIKDAQGEIVETWEDLCARVARHIVSDEKTEELKHKYVDAYYQIIHDLYFLPNTPTLMNAGKEKGQLMACFVLPIEDNMNSIMETAKNAAFIQKGGGGTGFSFGELRPKDSRVQTTSGVASGPVTFIKMYNDITECIKQGGTRRGANMAILPCWHPDILEFIDCKQDTTQITNFNISVAITDKFMDAVHKDEEYELIDPHTNKVVKKLKAKDVFDKIIKNAHQTGEPGLFFIDTTNQANKYGEIESTNPCGEMPLRAYEACTLGSLNISKYVVDGKFDWNLLEEHIRVAVRFLDSVVSVNHYPLEIIEKTHKETRKIGLGIMGFADALIKMGIIYGSDKSIKFGKELFAFIDKQSKIASTALGKEKGVCKACTDLSMPYRNYWTTTIAPTGTISIIANCSSGIEPIFAVAYIRTVMDKTTLIEFNPIFREMLVKNGVSITEALKTKILSLDSIQSLTELPVERELFVTSADVSAEQHVRMQAAFQQHCDSGVSKTINLPSTATLEDVRTAYELAYKLKCKGITVYRDGSRPDQVLSTKKTEKPKERQIRNRPRVTQGTVEKIDSSLGKLYLSINGAELEDDPLEVFLHIGKSGADINGLCEALGRLISLSLQHGIPIPKIAKQLKGIKGEEFLIVDKQKYVSILDLIGKRLESYYKEKQEEDKESSTLIVCPECDIRVYRVENCYKCMSCGWSKC